MSQHNARNYDTQRWPEYKLPPEQQAILDAEFAPNGLKWEGWFCTECGKHLCDQAIVLGCLRKRCFYRCKYPNVKEFNRVGEMEGLKSGVTELMVPVMPEAIPHNLIAPNGLQWRRLNCTRCGQHYSDEAVLFGQVRKGCTECHMPNVPDISRAGVQQLVDKLRLEQP